jgi:hypothetical protein
MFTLVNPKLEKRISRNKFDCILEIVYNDPEVIVLKLGLEGETEVIAFMKDEQDVEDWRVLRYWIKELVHAKMREATNLRDFYNSLASKCIY